MKARKVNGLPIVLIKTIRMGKKTLTTYLYLFLVFRGVSKQLLDLQTFTLVKSPEQ